MENQYEQYEYARKRVKQKKRLYFHFILFLIGSVFFIILNKILKFGEEYNWFVWAIVTWLFFFTLHFVNVFVTNTFMGKEWVQKQTEKLIQKQQNKIKQLEKKVEKQYPLPPQKETPKIEPEENTQ